MITQVIKIHAVDHEGISGSRGNGGEMTVQLTLAGETAVLGIAAVVRVVELPGRTLLVTDADPGRLGSGLLQQMGRQSR